MGRDPVENELEVEEEGCDCMKTMTSKTHVVYATAISNSNKLKEARKLYKARKEKERRAQDKADGTLLSYVRINPVP